MRTASRERFYHEWRLKFRAQQGYPIIEKWLSADDKMKMIASFESDKK